MLFQTKTCPVTGLPLQRRPNWENLQLAPDYNISFCIIGDGVLFSKGKGSASDVGSLAYIHQRQRVLNESGLINGQFTEILDYSEFKGFPTSKIRLAFKKMYQKNIEEEKLVGFWIIGPSKIIKWYYEVGAVMFFKNIRVSAVNSPRNKSGAIKSQAGD